VLEAGVGGLLGAAEVPREEPGGDGDPADQIADRELEEGQVPPRADPRRRDDRERRGLGGDDREEDRPGGEAAGAEEVVTGRLLGACCPDADEDVGEEIDDDRREVESVQGSVRGGMPKSKRSAVSGKRGVGKKMGPPTWEAPLTAYRSPITP
jgi:hypothetical protein